MTFDIIHNRFDSDINFGRDTSFYDYVSVGRSYLETGYIVGRNLTKNIFGSSEDVAEVNGPEGNKGQNIWDGTYRVQLKRQRLLLGKVLSISYDRIFSIYEEVTISWLNRDGLYIPIILDNNTLNFFTKSVMNKIHLVDFGEQILRSSISNDPETTGSGDTDHPFADNQFDNPTTIPNAEGSFDENSDKVVKNPGGEVFLDKFGRVVFLSRHNSNHQFLLTAGKVDSGQDDVSSHTTVSSQDTYYDAITNDESKPDATDLSEPFEPKSLNLSQYQQVPKIGKLKGDTDPNRSVTFGVLPRFDKWKFVPIVVRKYAPDSDGEVVGTDIYSVYQERGNCKYVRTITDGGDVKVFIPRHENVRIVGDSLTSVGGNVELKMKTMDRLPSGTTNPNNIIHQEYLTDGTIRIRTNENVSTGKARFDQKIDSDGSMELYINSSGGSSSDYNLKITLDASDGTINIDSKKDVNINASGGVEVTTSDGTTIGGGSSLLEKAVTGDTLKTYLDALYTSLSNWIVVPADGGAALKASLASFFAVHANTNYLSKHNNKVS